MSIPVVKTNYNLNSNIFSKDLVCDNFNITTVDDGKYLFKDPTTHLLIGHDAPNPQNIDNSMIASNAAIDRTKLAADSSNTGKMLYNDSNGDIKALSSMWFDSNRLYLYPPHSIILGQQINFGVPEFTQFIMQSNTTNATATSLYNGSLLSNYVYLMEFRGIAYNSTDKLGSTFSGKVKINNFSTNTRPTFGELIDYLQIEDTGMENCEITIDSNDTANCYNFWCHGLADKNICWRFVLNIYGLQSV